MALSACCARAASGQGAADPAITLMKSRRRIASPPRLHYGGITAGIWDQRNEAKRPVCNATISSCSCPLWVKSVVSDAPADVHFEPLATKVQRTKCGLFDHLVRGDPQTLWHVEAKRLRGLEVDHEIKLGRQLYGQIGRLFAPQNAVHIEGG